MTKIDDKKIDEMEPVANDPKIEDPQTELATDSAPSDDMAQLKAELDSVKSQLMRALADYQNLEKRVAESRIELSRWATAEMIKKLLPALDNLEMAVGGASDDDRKSGWFKGVEMAVKQLKQTLKDEGLEPIKADGHFDPSLHEAVDSIDGENDKIMKVVEIGYNLNGKILRPSKVVVGRSTN